ncbi:MAG: iron-molybdenum cofactor biosynthesis protein [candidate division WOR-3 bacterium]|jgi:nitrogen fixation protein NifB|nr:iron-molybdenum cofactor biosynthesis protein [candidate division WOR-3 bacterium]MCR4424463.1 NifB/NifX family molybdenum-iron cluster-binding protein [candidate division WOR-3 bacterium]MDH7519688.1 NifB/NifX family molybdenum-iron cluster-binding protein [bacterium]
MKRITVATDDGKNIAQHFGRSRMFVICEIEDSGYRRCAVRANEFTGHSRGECGKEKHHSHSAIVEALKDCDAVICRGMGQRAIADLVAAGIKPLFVTRETDVEGAVQDYLAGKLSEVAGACPGHQE